MAELPKFARERLNQPAAGPHPDADLITALVENSLTTREHGQVLDHLARCAQCRAVAALALPEPEAMLPQPRTEEQKRWARWTVMRWATLAASAVVIAIAVLVLRPEKAPQKQYFPNVSETSPAVEPPPRAPGAASVDEQREATSLAQAPTKAATTAKKDVDRGRLAENRAPLPAKEEAKSGGQLDKLSRGDAGQPASSKVQIAPGIVASPQTANAYMQSNQAQQQPVGGPYANQASRAQAQVQQNANTVAIAPTPPPPPRSTNETVEVTAAPAPAAPSAPKQAKDARVADGVVGGIVGGAVPSSAKAVPAEKTKSPGAASEVVTVEAAATPVANRAVADFKQLASPPARWTISANGTVERSFDDGRTWSVVPVAHAVVFRAISANGGDIWAGGAGGALFHSIDGGTEWKRVRAGSNGLVLTADISRVEFSDPLHGTVTTVGGDRWMTGDGGQTWSLQTGR